MWGNSPIITTVFQILLNRIELGMRLPEAVAAPRASQRNTASCLRQFARPAVCSAETNVLGTGRDGALPLVMRRSFTRVLGRPEP